MSNETTSSESQEVEALAPEWFERAREAADRFDLQTPEDVISPDEAERQLRQFGRQRGGE